MADVQIEITRMGNMWWWRVYKYVDGVWINSGFGTEKTYIKAAKKAYEYYLIIK